MNNRKVFGGLVAIIILALGAYLLPGTQLLSEEKPGQLFKPDNIEIVQLGQQIYAENCASCHGANLEGQTPDWRSTGTDGKLPAPPHNASGHTWHHTDELLFNLTKFGLAEAAGLRDYESNMPIYKDILTDEEIIAVMSFIKSTWPTDLRDQHDRINAANAKVKSE